MSKGKILVVSNMYPDSKHPNYGVFVKNFCKQLEAGGISYDLSVLRKQDSKIAKIVHYGLFLLKTVWKCLTSQYRYVYIHYLSVSSIPVIWAAKFKKMRIIANAHGTDVIPENARHESCQKNTRAILKLAEKIVVPSAYFKDYVNKKYRDLVQGKEIYVYPSGGINGKVFHRMEDNSLVYDAYGLKRDYIYMGYCGRIAKAKGMDTLLKAAKIVAEKYPNFRLIIVGNGEYENEMNRQIQEYGLEEKVIRYSMMSQVKLCEIYNILDAFLFPTEGESLGLVAVEAMACGTPVIASDFAAPAYYVKDNVNGFKFPKGDYQAMAERMIQFCEHNLHDEKLVQGALECASDYRVEIVQPKLLEIVK